MALEAVIFDLDGTLLDYDAKLMFGKLADCLGTDRRTARQLVAEFLAGVTELWPPTPDAAPGHWERFAVALGEHAAIADAALPALIRMIQGFSDGYVAFPDTGECLRKMDVLPLAVLTNNHVERVPAVLARCGIDPALFTVTLACYRHDFEKPQPEAFLTSARMLGVDPAHCAFVDDTPGHVRAARAVGMHAWLIDRRDQHVDFDGRRVRTLARFADEVIQLADRTDGPHR